MGRHSYIMTPDELAQVVSSSLGLASSDSVFSLRDEKGELVGFATATVEYEGPPAQQPCGGLMMRRQFAYPDFPSILHPNGEQ